MTLVISRRVVSIALLVIALFIVATPTVALFYGGDILNVGLTGSDASNRVGLTGGAASSRISLLPGSDERAVAVDMLWLIIVLIAVGIIFGIIGFWATGNILYAFTSAVIGMLTVAIVQAVLRIL